MDELYLPANEFDDVSPKSTDKTEEQRHIKSLKQKFPELKNLFVLHRQVGHGTFSTVFLASLKNDIKQFAIKHIIPTCHPDRIKYELQCLKDIGGVDNVAGVELCLRNENNVILIMPYQPHDSFNDYVGDMDAAETASYMKNLLKAVARVHSFNIVHRDIKPSNFLYDRKNKQYLLVDFGLAHSVTKKSDESTKRKRDASSPNAVTQQSKRRNSQASKLIVESNSQKENDPRHTVKPTNRIVFTRTSPPASSTIAKKLLQKDACRCYGKPRTCANCLVRKNIRAFRAGTPGFRPPEVLLKSTEQDTGIDVWAVGVVFLSILSNCCNFLSSPDDVTALAEIITLFGLEEVKKVARQCSRYLICSEEKHPLDLRKICRVLRARSKIAIVAEGDVCKDCAQFQNICMCPGTDLKMDVNDDFPDSAYDLLKRLLDVNPKSRITANDALQHPFLKNA